MIELGLKQTNVAVATARAVVLLKQNGSLTRDELAEELRHMQRCGELHARNPDALASDVWRRKGAIFRRIVRKRL